MARWLGIIIHFSSVLHGGTFLPVYSILPPSLLSMVLLFSRNLFYRWNTTARHFLLLLFIRGRPANDSYFAGVRDEIFFEQVIESVYWIVNEDRHSLHFDGKFEKSGWRVIGGEFCLLLIPEFWALSITSSSYSFEDLWKIEEAPTWWWCKQARRAIDEKSMYSWITFNSRRYPMESIEREQFARSSSRKVFPLPLE